jgi:hypothetical protein
MGRSMAHIAHQPGPVCLEGGVSRWLVGVVGLGAELHQRPHVARGALLQIDWRILKRAVPRPSGPGPEGLAGVVPLRRLSPGGAGRRRKAVAFHNPQALSNVQEESPSCARDPGGNRKTTGADTPMALSALSCE